MMTEPDKLTRSVAELWEELTAQGTIAAWQPRAVAQVEHNTGALRVLADDIEQLELLPVSLREACNLYLQGDFLQMRRKLQHLPDKADRIGFLGRLLKLLALLRVQQTQQQIHPTALHRIWDEGKLLRHESAELDELLEWLWHFCHRRENMPDDFWGNETRG